MLKENDIRPDDLMAGQAERFANDIRRLMAHRAEFVEVPCPACGSEHRSFRFNKYDLDYVECKQCETMYISPRPTPALLDMYYSQSENYAYWNKYIFPASEAPRREKIFRPRAQRLADACRRYGVGTGMLLEVGAGFGTFGECVRDLNMFDRIVAVEPTPDLANTCRAKGLEVIEQPVEHIDLSKYQADVVASFEVIEHLFSPKLFMTACARVLRPGGLLFISCPNGKGFDIATMGEHAGVVDVEHVNYFNPGSISHLAQECGFEVLEVSTPGSLDAELVRKAVLAGTISVDKGSLLKTILIDRWEELGAPFQTFLSEHQLSGHMVLVARKPK